MRRRAARAARLLAHILAVASVAAVMAAAARASEMFDPNHCDEKGAKEIVRPQEPYVCPRSGYIQGIRLKDECSKALRHIVEGIVDPAPPQLPGDKFCRPGREMSLMKSEFTCYCTDKKQWDCHKGITPNKPMPGSFSATRRGSMPRAMPKVPRKCEADILIHKMFTDFCNMYGSYVTYDDCITPRNNTIRIEGLQARDTPVVCLPGSYTIYMRCQLCRCAGGVFQQDCEFVDCPWSRPPDQAPQ